MHIVKYSFLLALSLGLLAPVASAQEFSAPNREQRQGMSYEEYRELREKMRTHIDKRQDSQNQQTQEENSRPAQRAEREEKDSAYGQGYNSRKHSDDGLNSSTEKRSDRPRFDRFNRGDRARR